MKNSLISINTKNSNYNIIIGANLINDINKIFKKNKINSEKYLIVYDSKVPFKIINTLKKKN